MKVGTARLRLEAPAERDFAALVGLWQDERVQRFLGGTLPKRRAEERVAGVFAHWGEHGFGLFAVRERSSGRLAGLCGLDHFGDDIEVAYKFWPDFWGRGYATEAAAGSLTYGFCELQPERIVAIVREANQGSRRVLEKLGMTYERDMTMWGAEQRFYTISLERWTGPDRFGRG